MCHSSEKVIRSPNSKELIIYIFATFTECYRHQMCIRDRCTICRAPTIRWCLVAKTTVIYYVLCTVCRMADNLRLSFDVSTIKVGSPTVWIIIDVVVVIMYYPCNELSSGKWLICAQLFIISTVGRRLGDWQQNSVTTCYWTTAPTPAWSRQMVSWKWSYEKWSWNVA